MKQGVLVFFILECVAKLKENFFGCFCSAYDRAAIKFRGAEADINFSIEDYEDDLKQVRERRNKRKEL